MARKMELDDLQTLDDVSCELTGIAELLDFSSIENLTESGCGGIANILLSCGQKIENIVKKCRNTHED